MADHFLPLRPEEQRALALLYVDKHATADSTPEQLCDLYREADAAIKNYCKSSGSMKVGC